MLPANGPTPPTTATITASQSGITRRRTAARQSSDITIQPIPCTQPSTATIVLAARGWPPTAARDRRPRACRRVPEHVAAQNGLKPGSTPSGAAPDRPPRARRRVGRPPGVLVVLGVARDLGALRQPGQADEHHQPVGQRDQRLDRQPLRRHRPLLLELAAKRFHRVLADLDRPAGAECPAAGPGRDPRRASPGQPAAVGVAREAQRGQRPRRVLAHQPQRPAHRLQLELESPLARLVSRQPGREPVVRRRAAVLEGGDRLVGRLAVGRGRLVLLLAPAARHLIRLPGAAGEDAGWVGHCVQ